MPDIHQDLSTSFVLLRTTHEIIVAFYQKSLYVDFKFPYNIYSIDKFSNIQVLKIRILVWCYLKEILQGHHILLLEELERISLHEIVWSKS